MKCALANAGLLGSVTLRRQVNGGVWSTVRQVQYSYYDGTQTYGGSVGDLMTATVSDGSGNVLSTEYYRYYTSGRANPHQHGLHYVFTPQSYARLTAALGTNLSSLTDAQVAPYADNAFQYHSSQRVTQEFVAGTGDSQTGGGLGTYGFSYTASANTPGFNSWAMKTVVSNPDGSTDTVYTNFVAEVMLDDHYDPASALHTDQADRPNDPFTLFNLGWAYADLGRCADALPLLQHSLRYSHPADSITPKLYVLLAQCHRRLGQHTEAWGACQAGNVRCPDDDELLFLKGQLCHERGDRAAAHACWIQLLPPTTATPTLPSPDGVFTSVDAGLRGPLVRHHLAMLSSEQGQHADAEFYWKAALPEASTYPPARLLLEETIRQAPQTPAGCQRSIFRENPLTLRPSTARMTFFTL